jgi:hypothetical protein
MIWLRTASVAPVQARARGELRRIVRELTDLRRKPLVDRDVARTDLEAPTAALMI